MSNLRRLPKLRYCVRLWRRSLIIFAFLRAVAAQGSAAIDKASGVPRSGLSFPAFVILLAVVGWLVLLSARMRREPPMMENLGVGPGTVLLIAVGPLVGIELLIRLVA